MQSSNTTDVIWRWNGNMIGSAERAQMILLAINCFFPPFFQNKVVFLYRILKSLLCHYGLKYSDWKKCQRWFLSLRWFRCYQFRPRGIRSTLWWPQSPKSVQEFLTALIFFVLKKIYIDGKNAWTRGTLLNFSNAVSKVMYSISLFWKRGGGGGWCNLKQHQF